MIVSTIREQLAVLVLARVITPSEATAPQLADPTLVIPRPNTVEEPSAQLPTEVGDAEWPANCREGMPSKRANWYSLY
ncbi:UNVERIFIED_CONTAM: hypothetical protein Sradi_5882800 [Sesamum radiatum]|uniref:Secreted protein n=1 Tax=Sesamum radiatum TaxID=300843 RepID=A0AAW2KR27_SESRA